LGPGNENTKNISLTYPLIRNPDQVLIDFGVKPIIEAALENAKSFYDKDCWELKKIMEIAVK
jgi:hypothetical protein